MLRGYPPITNTAGNAAVDRQQDYRGMVVRLTQHVARLVYPDTLFGVPARHFNVISITLEPG